MSLLRLTRRSAGIALLSWLGALSVNAASPPASSQANIEAMTRAVEAVVGLEVTATEGARSAETLGRDPGHHLRQPCRAGAPGGV